MLFNSYEFAIFFILVVFSYYLVPRKIRLGWLLAASYMFYTSWNPKYIFILIGLTLISYFVALTLDLCVCRIENNKRQNVIKAIVLWIGIILITGILTYFKIGNVPPLGISFITFQVLGYIIDVYSNRITAEKNICKYALFVSFFPQVSSGPIGRANELLPQICNIGVNRRITYDKFVKGLTLMLFGYWQKMVVADKLSILVTTVFAAPEQYDSVILVVAMVAFSIQIYCDFGGYSCIAIGAAQVLGIELKENFNAPYFSMSIQEFWRRWHISLSSWLRDYIYIPLGGNRYGKVRKNFNLLITFLVSGLWHGMQPRYIVWGGFHGGYQIVQAEWSDFLKKHKRASRTKGFGNYFINIITTYVLVSFAWIFFRAKSVGSAVCYIERMFTTFQMETFYNGAIYRLGLCVTDVNVLIFSIGLLVFFDLIKYIEKIEFSEFILKQNIVFRWMVLIILIVCIVLFGEYGTSYKAGDFIYLQF